MATASSSPTVRRTRSRVIDAKHNVVKGSVDLSNSHCNDPDHNRHFQPRGLAVTQDSTKLYVTRFLSFVHEDDGVQGVDAGREGIVCRLDVNTDSDGTAGPRPGAMIKI